MIKQGHRICLNYDMKRKGVVTEVIFEKPKQWTSAGPTADRQMCRVTMDDGEELVLPINDLRPEW
jgi:ribosomal protein S12